MGQFVIQRIGASLLTIVLLVFLTAIFRTLIPGDAVDLIMLESRDPEAEALLRSKLGLDDPAIISVGKYMLNAFQGDLGESLWGQRSVASMISSAFPVSMELTIIAVVISMIVAIPVGIISAISRDTILDYVARTGAIMGITVPTFVIGTLVVTLPAIWWGWSPPFRYTEFTANPIANLQQMWIPALTMGILLAASTMRLTRTMLLEVIHQDYMRTASAKGLKTGRVIRQHGLPNAIIPVVAHSGLQIAALLGGTAVIEQIFGLPGMGRLMLDAIGSRDYPVVQGLILVTGVIVVCINLISDLLVGMIDPRIRYS